MDSYFFVPGHKLHNIDKIKALSVDEIIIDLEDAVKASDRKLILSNLIAKSLNYKEYYIRLPLYSQSGEKLDTQILLLLLQNGFRKLVFPKVASFEDFELLHKTFISFSPRIILLVETPRLLLEAKDLILKYAKCFSGIAVGSHDFMNIIGGLHTLKNLEFFRLQVLYLARTIQVPAIDIASMELGNIQKLRKEIEDAVYKGFDAKLYIHPRQIEVLKTLRLYTVEEFEWAQKVQNALKQVQGEKDEFDPIIINGEVIEKPHLKRVEKILNYYKKNEKF